MKNFDTLLNRFGRTFYIIDNNGNKISEAKCMMQPLRYKNKMYLEGTPTDIGENDAGYYLLFAPASFELKNSDNSRCLFDGEKKYVTDRTEKIYYGDTVMYTWAVIKNAADGEFPYYDHFCKGDR